MTLLSRSDTCDLLWNSFCFATTTQKTTKQKKIEEKIINTNLINLKICCLRHLLRRVRVMNSVCDVVLKRF